jgi:hypothetical protein
MSLVLSSEQLKILAFSLSSDVSTCLWLPTDKGRQELKAACIRDPRSTVLLPHTLRAFYKQIPDNGIALSKLQTCRKAYSCLKCTICTCVLHTFVRVCCTRFYVCSVHVFLSSLLINWTNSKVYHSAKLLRRSPQYDSYKCHPVTSESSEVNELCRDEVSGAATPLRRIPQHGFGWVVIPRLEIYHAGDSSASRFSILLCV